MRNKKKRIKFQYIPLFVSLSIILLVGSIVGYYWYIDASYQNRIFPAVTIDDVPFGGNTKEDVALYWERKSTMFDNVSVTFTYENSIATVSSEILDLKYNATLLKDQAYSIGRTNEVFRNAYYRFFVQSVNLPSVISWNDDVLSSIIASFSSELNRPSQDALFQFSNGKVISFKPSSDGKKVNEDEFRSLFQKALPHLSTGQIKTVFIPVPVDTIKPNVATGEVNPFGIKERIGYGHSKFSGSIPGRIHNIALAASKLNGVLIKPQETFSFNKTVGDISAATGYQSAYIIKNGRTVLGDGGGVCQVSTTLFRAALNAGLPIVERHEHSYRVHYYEEGGYKAGLDATVFDPTDDLKFKNDTPGYILIQTKIDIENVTLIFELYGQNDGRKSEILNHIVWGIEPPPAPLYQDDPTLPSGTIKQVDFAAWGAKASFDYKVSRGNDVLHEQKFYSNYRPWQAVFLKGTK